MMHGVAAGLEDVVEAQHVAADVGVGVLDAVAHAGLGGQIDHDVRLELLEEAVHQGLVGDVPLDEAVAVLRMLFGLGLDEPQAVLLERRVVVVVQVVQAKDVQADGSRSLGGGLGIGKAAYDGLKFGKMAVEEPKHQVGTDEAGGAGNENIHLNF